MTRFRNYVLMAAGFAVLVMVVGVFSAGPAIAQAVRAALVSNVDEPGRIPYQAAAGCVFGGFDSCDINFPFVPAGKRLVITQVSGIVEENLPGGTLVQPMVSSSTGRAAIYVPVVLQGSSGGMNFFSFNQTFTMFVDPGNFPQMHVTLGATPNSSSNATFYFYGYMLDCTTGPCAAIAP